MWGCVHYLGSKSESCSLVDTNRRAQDPNRLSHLIVVRVSDHAAAILLCVDGFSLATLDGVDEGYAPAFVRGVHQRRSGSAWQQCGATVCKAKLNVN